MKSMRELISLMESVALVPGIGNSVSEGKFTFDNYTVLTSTGKHLVYGPNDKDAMQAHLARQYGGSGARIYGDVISMEPYTGPVDTGRDDKSARSYWDEDVAVASSSPGGPGGAEANMQTAGTVGRNNSYAAFDAAQGQATEESAPPGMEDVVMSLKKEYPNDHSKAFATAWSIYNKKHGKANESVPAVDSCQQTNPASADIACAMEESRMTDYDLDFIRQSLDRNYELATSEDELKRMVAGETGYGNNPEFDNAFALMLDHFLNGDDTSFDHMDGPDDFSDDAEALASAGHGSDEDYGDFPIDEDLQNGYNDVEKASGIDFFPNGADSPVVSNVGPSGARQGDNPEQKKMQVAEVHKELVYGYRNFLKEAALSQKK